MCVCVSIGFQTFERWICATCNLLSNSHHSLPTKAALVVPHPNLPKVTCDGRGIFQTLTMLLVPFNSPKGVLPKKVANSITFYKYHEERCITTLGFLLQFSDGREMFMINASNINPASAMLPHQDCIDCIRGHFCQIGAVDPLECPAGTYGNATGLRGTGSYPGRDSEMPCFVWLFDCSYKQFLFLDSKFSFGKFQWKG